MMLTASAFSSESQSPADQRTLSMQTPTTKPAAETAIPKLHFESESLNLADGAEITSWASGTNGEFLQKPTQPLKGELFAGPKLVENVINGRAAVKFSNKSVLTGNALAQKYLANRSFTIFMVMRPDTKDFGISGNGLFGLGGVPRLYLLANKAVYNDLTPNIEIPEKLHFWQLLTYQYNAGNNELTVYRGGVKIKTVNGVKVASSLGNGGNLSVPFYDEMAFNNGYVAELLIISTHLQDAEREKIEKSLTVKYRENDAPDGLLSNLKTDKIPVKFNPALTSMPIETDGHAIYEFKTNLVAKENCPQFKMTIAGLRANDSRTDRYNAEFILGPLTPGQSLTISQDFYSRIENKYAIITFSGVTPQSLIISDSHVVLKRNCSCIDNPAVQEEKPDQAYPEAVPQIIVNSAALKQVENRTRMLINDQIVSPSDYLGPMTFTTWKGDHRIFSNAGVTSHKRFLLPEAMGGKNISIKAFWKGKNSYDFSCIKEQLQRVIRSSPDATVMLTITVDPYISWGEENPDEVCENQFGEKAIGVMHVEKWGGAPNTAQRYLPSLSSSIVREDIKGMYNAAIDYINSIPEGKIVNGYAIFGFCDGQFVPWDFSIAPNKNISDFSKPARLAFTGFLRKKYNDDVEKMRNAWGNPNVTFENASIASPERRNGNGSDGIFLNPAKFQDVADTIQFKINESVSLELELAEFLKVKTDNRKLVQFWYAGSLNSWPYSGGLSSVLNSPFVDILECPLDYFIRQPGYPGGIQTMPESVSLHGKIFRHELDFRSWRGVGNEGSSGDILNGRIATGYEHNNVIRRESGNALAHGTGVTFFDYIAGSWADNTIMQGVAEAMKAFNADFKNPDAPEADLAFFVNERSIDYINLKFANEYLWYSLRKQRQEWDTSGVPYHVYLQSDLENPKLPDYKIYVFVLPQLISEGEMAVIEKLKSKNRTLVFMQSPGTLNSGEPAKNIEKITGIKVAPLGRKTGFSGIWDKAPNPLLTGLNGQKFGNHIMPAAFGQAIADGKLTFNAWKVADNSATRLAAFPDGDEVAIAIKEFSNWKSVFIAMPCMEAAFINNLAAQSNAWVAAKPYDAVFGSQYFITVHAMRPGEKHLKLRYPSKVIDLISGKAVSEKTDSVALNMEFGETRWFSLEPQ